MCVISKELAEENNISLGDKIILLDPNNEKKIMDVFTRLAHQEGKCVIIVTHSKSVADIADEIYDLEKNNK